MTEDRISALEARVDALEQREKHRRTKLTEYMRRYRTKMRDQLRAIQPNEPI